MSDNNMVSGGWSAPTPKQMTEEDRIALVSAWSQAQANAAAAVAHERALRTAVMEACFATDKMEGTEHYALPGGADLCAVKKLDYKIDKEKINSVLDEVEALGDRAKLRSEELVKFEPSLSVSTYKKLAESTDEIDKQIYRLILPIVTEKPAAPSLKINPPKLPK